MYLQTKSRLINDMQTAVRYKLDMYFVPVGNANMVCFLELY